MEHAGGSDRRGGVISSRMRQLARGLRTLPSKRDVGFAALVTVVYFVLAGLIGFGTGLLQPGVLHAPIWLMIVVPSLLLLFPTLPEEAFFRGLLLPHPSSVPSRTRKIAETLISTVLFVLWHPLNAMTINPTAYAVFTDIRFLTLTALLGLACAITYLRSGSLWIPIAIHWLTILPWVFLLSGRNELLRRLQN